MRVLTEVDAYRDTIAEARYFGWGFGRDIEERAYGGVFRINMKPGRNRMLVIASRYWAELDTDFNPAWNHVSVSLPGRCPAWEEMCYVKDLFFDPEETVMQLHPPRSTWVSNHKYCLHLWEPVGEGVTIPLPPPRMVGNKELGELRHKRRQ